MILRLIIVFSALLTAACRPSSDRLMEQEINTLLRGRAMKVGVAVLLDGRPVAVVNNGRYPMMSVFKFHQAVAVAHSMAQRQLPLTHTLHIGRKELQAPTYSPLRDSLPDRDFDITVGSLLRYSVQYSDNHACDLLFRHLLSTEECRTTLCDMGLRHFDITATEEEMRQSPQTCHANWSTPLSAATLLDIFLRRQADGDPRFTFIADCMTSATTGNARLKRPFLNTAIRIGDKTGTGGRNERGELLAVNDIGFVTLPDGRHYTIAVFISNSRETPEATEEVIAALSEKVYTLLAGHTPQKATDTESSSR